MLCMHRDASSSQYGQLASSLFCHVDFSGPFTLHTPGIRPLCAYKYSQACELPAPLKHQSSLYTQCLEVGLAGRITTVLGKEKGKRKGDPIIWEGPLGPDSFPEPVFEFPPQHKSDFTNETPLRQYDNRREPWPKYRHGENLVQMCTDGMDGGRRFFKCPHAWVILGCFISLSSLRHLT